MTMAARGLPKLLEELGELVKECGQLSQTIGKRLAYFHADEHPDGAGLLSNRLQDEAADAKAAIEFVAEEWGFDRDCFNARVAQKLALFRAWHAATDNNRDGVDRSPQ